MNLGFVKAVNQGLKISRAPYVCVMNNDTVPGPGWLERMVEFAETHRDVGLINPQCNGHNDKTIEKYAESLYVNKGKYMEMNQCQGYCMLVKREVIEKIGYLDESFGVGGYDDTDYSMRAHKAGYRCAAIYDAYVYHRQHASFDKAGDREEWVSKNKKIYYGKWGAHLRIGVALSMKNSDENSLSKAINLAYGLMREWSWVYLWINSKERANHIKELINNIQRRNGLPPHQNFRMDVFNLPPFFFYISIVGKLLERMRRRMRDKRFDGIVLEDGDGARFISPFAKVVNTKLIQKSFDGDNGDWQRTGRDLAASIIKGAA